MKEAYGEVTYLAWNVISDMDESCEVSEIACFFSRRGCYFCMNVVVNVVVSTQCIFENVFQHIPEE